MVRTYATNPLYLRADAAPKTPRTPQQKLLGRMRDDYHRRVTALAPNADIIRRHHSAPVVRLPDKPSTPVIEPMATVGVTPVDQFFRTQDRAQRAEYKTELETQIKHQRAKRINEDAAYYGGVNLEALKAQKQELSASRRPITMQREDPPWLRGNPQPKNGVRGTRQWSDGQSIAKSPSMPTGLNYGAPPPSMHSFHYQPNIAPLQIQQSLHPARQRLIERQKAAAEEFYDPFGKGGAGAPIRDRDGNVVTDRRRMRESWSKTVDTNLPHDYAEAKLSRSNSFSNSYGAAQMPTMASSAYSNQVPLPQTYSTSPMPSNDYGLNRNFSAVDELRAIDPFAALSGANVGGYIQQRAPSRSYVQPSPIAGPQINLNSTLVGRQLSEKERHKLELEQQIAENKRLKEIERQKEMEEDARERKKMDEYNARQQAEIDAELRKQKEKAIEHERRAQEAAENARQQKNPINRQRGSDHPSNERVSNPAEKDDGLEWWERQDKNRNRGRTPAPAPPASSQLKRSSSADHRSGNGMYNTAEILTSEVTPSRASKRPEKSRRNSYKPSSAAVRNEGVMRQLSAMRERLTKEQIRVKSALRRNEYGEELFSDDDYVMPEDPKKEEPPSLMHRSNQRRPSNKASYDGLFEGDRKGLKSRASDRRGTEGELLDLIRSSRAVLDSAKSRGTTVRPPPRATQRNNMGGFLSDEDDDEHPDKIIDTFLRKRK